MSSNNPTSERPEFIERLRAEVRGVPYRPAKRKKAEPEPPDLTDASHLFTVETGNRWMDLGEREPKAKMLLGECWHQGELCILFADTNAGKSVLAVQIGENIARAQNTGPFACDAEPEKVLYVDFELTTTQFYQRYNHPEQGGHNFSNNFFRAKFNPATDTPQNFKSFDDFLLAGLEYKIGQVKATVLIIDNITCLRGGTESAAVALRLMNNLKNLNTNGAVVNQVFKDNALNFSNEFNVIKSLKSNNIIQAYSYISHSAEPENRTIGPNYNDTLFNKSVPYAQLLQNVNVPAWYTNNYLSFKIPANLITQSYRTGFSVQSETLTSNLGVLQNNNSFTQLSDSSMNHLNWTRKKLYAEAAYDMPGTILKANLTLPLSLQQIGYSDSLYALNKHLTHLYFNPQLRVKYQTSIENYLTFLYNYRNQTGTIEDLYRGYILTDYRSLLANNADLTESQNQTAAVGFNYRKALTLFFASLNVLYNHITSNNIASEVITNTLQQRVMLPYANSTNSWTVNGTVSKYSFALKTTFSGGLLWQSNSSVQIQNNALLPFNTTSETANISADTKVNDQVNFSYKATLTQTDSHSAVEASAFHIDQLLQQAEVNYNPSDNMQFKLSGEHYFTRQQGNPDLKYFFADASIKFRLNKLKTDVQLSAENFLNVKTYNALYLSANTLTASSYTMPGRIILLKVMFNL